MAKKNINYRPGKAQARMNLVVGVIFVFLGLCVVIPATTHGLGAFGLLFGLAWTGIAIYNTVVNAKAAFGSEEDVKEYFGGYVVTEEESPKPTADGDHDHIPSTALDAQKRLEQLQKLKQAGLITEAEFSAKRQDILDEL